MIRIAPVVTKRPRVTKSLKAAANNVTPAQVKSAGRPRRHSDDAERQRAYRARKAANA